MKNKLMPMLAKTVVLLSVITISGLLTNGQKFDRSRQTSAGRVLRYEVINNAAITFGSVAIKDAVTSVNKIEQTRTIDPPDLT